MSLRSQIAELLIVISLILVGIMYTVQLMVVMPTFSDLERTIAIRNVERCTDALERELQSISNTTTDWSNWDDSYRFIHDHNSEFVAGNLTSESFGNSNLNLICYVDMNRHIVWGEVHDIKTLEKMEVPDLFAAIQSESSPFTLHERVEDASAGILLTSKGALMLASRPIVTTKRKGPIRGTLLMGRFLNQTETDELAERTHVQLDTWTAGQRDMPAETRRIFAQHSLSCQPDSKAVDAHIETADVKTLYGYGVVNDLYGKPALLLRVTVPRDITEQGWVSTKVAAWCSVVGGGVTLSLMWIVLQWRIISPLRRMAAHAVMVGQSSNLKARLDLRRADEIGTLANEFDRMVESLAESREKVLETAHRSGMAEVAAEVLHNVGNAVNSAGCSVNRLRERLSESKISGFDRATAMLREQAPRAAEFFGTDPRGPKLVDYLLDLNDALRQEHNDLQAEVIRLNTTVGHIRDVIDAQQHFAGQSEFRQEVELSALVDDALLLNRELLDSHRIEVKVDLPPLPKLLMNKSKMTQVLVNLVRNAVQAMQSRDSGERRLTISARTVEGDGIEIEVHDTGCGFDEGVRMKLFTHGFTTTSNGNGLGLHYCANAIQGAGGTVTAESPGPGLGATFRVRLFQALQCDAIAS